MFDMRRITGMRMAISVWLMAALLGVSPAAFWTSLFRSPADCSSRCCRSKRTCCCRKPKAAGASEESLSAKECRGGCCQPRALGTGAAAVGGGHASLSAPALAGAEKCLPSGLV